MCEQTYTLTCMRNPAGRQPHTSATTTTTTTTTNLLHTVLPPPTHLPTHPPTRAHPSRNNADARTRTQPTRGSGQHVQHPNTRQPSGKIQSRTHILREPKRTSAKAAQHTPQNTRRRVASSPWPSSSAVPCRAERISQTQASRKDRNEQISHHKQQNKQTSTAAAVAILLNNNTTPYIGGRQQRANIPANLHAQPRRPPAAHILTTTTIKYLIHTALPPAHPPTRPATTRTALTRTPPTRAPRTQSDTQTPANQAARSKHERTPCARPSGRPPKPPETRRRTHAGRSRRRRGRRRPPCRAAPSGSASHTSKPPKQQINHHKQQNNQTSADAAAILTKYKY
jgi:hypothetical protein